MIRLALAILFIVLCNTSGSAISMAESYVPVENSRNLAQWEAFSIDASCPQGASVVSGGYTITNASGNKLKSIGFYYGNAHPLWLLVPSISVLQDNAVDNGWRVAGKAISPTAIEVRAICYLP